MLEERHPSFVAGPSASALHFRPIAQYLGKIVSGTACGLDVAVDLYHQCVCIPVIVELSIAHVAPIEGNLMG